MDWPTRISLQDWSWPVQHTFLYSVIFFQPFDQRSIFNYKLRTGKRFGLVDMSEGTGKEYISRQKNEEICVISVIHGSPFRDFIVADSTHRPAMRIVILHKITRHIASYFPPVQFSVHTVPAVWTAPVRRAIQIPSQRLHLPFTNKPVIFCLHTWLSENSPSLEAVSRSAGQEIFRLLLIPKLWYIC